MSTYEFEGLGAGSGLDIRVEDLEEAVAKRNPTAARAEVRSAIDAIVSIAKLLERLREQLGPSPSTSHVERHTGSGLVDPIDPAEGRRRLAAFATPLAVEDWAGPVAGPSEVASRLGISRSTLHGWSRSGLAIALRKGARKHVYPLAQFADGRPISGLAAVVEIVGDPRSAWLWLVEEHRGAAPSCLERLRRGEMDAVLEAAREDFA